MVLGPGWFGLVQGDSGFRERRDAARAVPESEAPESSE